PLVAASPGRTPGHGPEHITDRCHGGMVRPGDDPAGPSFSSRPGSRYGVGDQYQPAALYPVARVSPGDRATGSAGANGDGAAGCQPIRRFRAAFATPLERYGS